MALVYGGCWKASLIVVTPSLPWLMGEGGMLSLHL